MGKKETRMGDTEDLKLEVSRKLCWIGKYILASSLQKQPL